MNNHVAPLQVSEWYNQHECGLWLDVDNDKYHSAAGVGSHNITEIRDDIDLYLSGEKEEIDKDHFILGSAFHDKLMRPEYYEKNYVVYPGKVRRGGKWDEFRFDNAAKTILTMKMNASLQFMVENAHDSHEWQAVEEYKRSAPVIFEGSGWVQHPDTGIMCKFRPDVFMVPGKIIDIKTASNPHWESSGKYKKGFKYAVRNYNYNVQQAFYMDMCNYAGIPCKEFGFFVVGSTEPYDVEYYELPNTWVMEGRKAYETQLLRLKNKLIGG